MHPANERWYYSVLPSLIGWAHTQNDPCLPFMLPHHTSIPAGWRWVMRSLHSISNASQKPILKSTLWNWSNQLSWITAKLSTVFCKCVIQQNFFTRWCLYSKNIFSCRWATDYCNHTAYLKTAYVVYPDWETLSLSCNDWDVLNPALLKQYDTDWSLSAICSTAFKYKLCWHWLCGLQQQNGVTNTVYSVTHVHAAGYRPRKEGYCFKQEISRIIHMVSSCLCLVVVEYWLILPISLRVTSLALGQSYDCPSACEVTLRNMRK